MNTAAQLLPENEAVLRARFPVAYHRVMAAQSTQPWIFL